MSHPASRRCPSRRQFVLQIASPVALAMAGLLPREAEAAQRERSLLLQHMHTGETLNAVYYADGRYLPAALAAATHHLRDWRLDLAMPVDPKLLDLLWALRTRLGSKAPVNVLCGYRSPATNAMLRRHSRAVALNSLHMQAMAIDIRLPDRSLASLRQAAAGLQAGGVGYYPWADFVHVDTGPVRYW